MRDSPWDTVLIVLWKCLEGDEVCDTQQDVSCCFSEQPSFPICKLVRLSSSKADGMAVVGI